MDRDSDAKSEIQSEFTIRQDLDGLYLSVESNQIWTEFQYDFVFSENYFLLERLVYSRRAKSVMIWLRKSSTYIDLFCFVPPLTKRNHFAWRQGANEFVRGLTNFGHLTERNHFAWRQGANEFVRGLTNFGHVTERNHFAWRQGANEKPVKGPWSRDPTKPFYMAFLF